MYHTLDGESVPFGPEEDRHSIHGSPVVPNTATYVPVRMCSGCHLAADELYCCGGNTPLVCCRRIISDKEGYVLYTVVVLKKYMDSFQEAAREERFHVREFEFKDTRAGAAAELAEAEATEQGALVRTGCVTSRVWPQLTQVCLVLVHSPN